MGLDRGSGLLQGLKSWAIFAGDQCFFLPFSILDEIKFQKSHLKFFILKKTIKMGKNFYYKLEGSKRSIKIWCLKIHVFVPKNKKVLDLLTQMDIVASPPNSLST